MNQLPLFDVDSAVTPNLAADAAEKPQNVETHVPGSESAIDTSVERSTDGAMNADVSTLADCLAAGISGNYSAEAISFCAALSLTVPDWQKLTRACTTEELVTIYQLLKAQSHRSPYRAKMAQQIRQWVNGDGVGKPLTWYQFDKCKPTWPVHVVFPKTILQ